MDSGRWAREFPHSCSEVLGVGDHPSNEVCLLGAVSVHGKCLGGERLGEEAQYSSASAFDAEHHIIGRICFLSHCRENMAEVLGSVGTTAPSGPVSQRNDHGARATVGVGTKYFL